MDPLQNALSETHHVPYMDLLEIRGSRAELPEAFDSLEVYRPFGSAPSLLNQKSWKLATMTHMTHEERIDSSPGQPGRRKRCKNARAEAYSGVWRWGSENQKVVDAAL